MTLGNSPHQSGCTAPGFYRVGRRAVVQQHLDRLGITRACRHHQRGVSIFRHGGIRIGSCLDECCDDCRISVHSGELQRRGACARRGRYICACADKEFGRFQVIQADRPMERRGAIGLRGIYIRLFLQQGTHSRLITLHRGVRQVTNGSAENCSR